MHIRIMDTNRAVTYEVLCDVCGQMIDLDEDCDYLLQIKGNQPDIQEALQVCLGDAHETRPAAQTAEKKGTLLNAAGCGLI